MKQEKAKAEAQAERPGLIYVIVILSGVVMGFSVSELLDQIDIRIPVLLFLLFAALLVSLFLHIVIHELGHLVFGLVSDYAFKSFRVGSFILVKYEVEGFRLKRNRIAGMGGQCLLDPPGTYGDPFPYRLYLYGGILFNVVFSAVLSGLCLFLQSGAQLRLFAIVFTLVGLLVAFVNWMPVKEAFIPNDGTNARILSRNRESGKYLWAQLKIAALNQEGVRMKNMPEAYFQADADDYLASSLRVFRIGRLIDAQDFDEAGTQIDGLLHDPSLVPLYKALLQLERVFIGLLTDSEDVGLGVLEKKSIRQIRQSMKNFPSILRFEYARALLLEGDEDRAEAIRKKFQKACSSYPNKADIESETELMELVAASYRKKQAEAVSP
ncbi:MAG: hypothetical protein QM296_06735 [Bacillota bacterium]|nr:hypothetical protein [Bacillota bacterium]